MNDRTRAFLAALGVEDGKVEQLFYFPNDKTIKAIRSRVRLRQAGDAWGSTWQYSRVALKFDDDMNIVSLWLVDANSSEFDFIADAQPHFIFERGEQHLQIDHKGRPSDELLERAVTDETQAMINATIVNLNAASGGDVKSLRFASNDGESIEYRSTVTAAANGETDNGASQEDDQAAIDAIADQHMQDIQVAISKVKAEAMRLGIDNAVEVPKGVRKGIAVVLVDLITDDSYSLVMPTVQQIGNEIVKAISQRMGMAMTRAQLGESVAEMLEVVLTGISDASSLEAIAIMFDTIWFEVDAVRASMVWDNYLNRRLSHRNSQDDYRRLGNA